MRVWVLSFLLAFFIPIMACADDVYKIGQMTCDEKNNSVMIRFGAAYRQELPEVMLPPQIEEEFGYLDKLPSKEECLLQDGRRISFSHGEGQSYAHGYCGADPDAHFSMDIDGKKVFYKKSWNSGRCDSFINPFVVLLTNEKLLSCRGPDNYFQTDFDKYQIPEKDCSDISERLAGNLENAELRTFKKDQIIERYEPVSKHDDVCNYFSDEDFLRNIEKGRYDNFSYDIDAKTRELLNKAPYSIGYVLKHDTDINNDRIAETVYQIGATNNYFNGSFLVFFTSEESRKNFEVCVFENKCPEDVPQDRNDDVDFITTHAELLWPGSHLISAASLDEEIKKEYRTRYTWLDAVAYDEKTYIYFDPLNNDTFPSSVVAKLKPDGKLETICTYKRAH